MSIIPSKRLHPFTTLPTEVCVQILEHLLPINKSFAIDRDDRAPNIGQARRLCAKYQTTPEIINILRVDQHTCRQALDIIYGRNTFTFNDPWLTETFMVRIGPVNLHMINHVEIQAGSLTKSNNNPTWTTLFSTISNNFAGLQTLKIVGVGRGKTIKKLFYPMQWFPSHLERLGFITSLSGVLKNANVYCDREENNTRLLCNGAEYRTAWDEDEVDMSSVRDEMKHEEKLAKKRKAGVEDVADAGDQVVASPKKTNGGRKKPKIKPHYGWKQ